MRRVHSFQFQSNLSTGIPFALGKHHAYIGNTSQYPYYYICNASRIRIGKPSSTYISLKRARRDFQRVDRTVLRCHLKRVASRAHEAMNSWTLHSERLEGSS